MDGGSTDGSLEIIQKYQDQLAWWISEKDSGQAEAVNKGLYQAHGEIVGWLNSDDLYLPEAVAQAVQAFEQHPEAGLVYADAISIDPAGNPLHRWTFKPWGLVDFMAFRVICQPAVFIRREILEQAGSLDASYQYMLDHQLWIKIASLAPVVHIPGLWAAARQHPQAKNVRAAAQFGLEIERIVQWMKAEAELKQTYQLNRRKIEAGAARLTARYLLDGDEPAKALSVYFQALIKDPAYTLQHAHRILFAMLSLAGGRGLAKRYYDLKSRRGLDLSASPDIADWPGIQWPERSQA